MERESLAHFLLSLRPLTVKKGNRHKVISQSRTGILTNEDDMIERKMYPIRIRFGIGIGKITTDVNKEMALGADGPGYYKARNAIEYLKDNERKKQAIAADIRFEIESDNQATTIMLNTILDDV